ncbi:hypothetical protein A3E39_01340 [Candidatus Uhrbacteria bacterium RIFCSPHIGHO2_12_FULL_60_25]|uniref:Glycosyltransferase subfamily 4-like N-terminal domain-containing protein n=1 Tax=Candidatus Uhrbacteria bacterium RIFCSPHIGHO2_12_FULL_60_25 TaxID=1802399 RepID=A0A1F7UM41_9BACT|nr:MAG: hypothetical protein A3D73_02145 [Candidatus Uhrbacteria bacterium RIFCSPHIGHO2_02_FULL_60_44]OGL78788.1 MAG: hypothetical protein A3E39_01340 [Candidatus Uhrbacteria bacterium RIFCSPHIGHO2_12_FULL_60_25]
MKIAYIANSRFPSEKAQSDQVMAVCSAFAALGHEVRLYVTDRTPVVADDPFAYYDKPKTFVFERVPCADALRWHWLGALGFWIQTATFIRALRPRLLTYRPDLVYSREPYVFSFGDVPGLRVWESHRVHSSWFGRRAMRTMDAIVTLTRASKERLSSFGFPSDRILVEPDAVDPALFAGAPDRVSARRALGIPDGEFVCLYTGKFLTMGMPKGLDEAIVAVAHLRGKQRKLRLIAVGGTPEEIARYRPRVQDGTELRGHVPQADLKRFYAAADLLLMPFPHTEHYALYMSPLKLFEYLMSGVPMVVTDLPSVREIVDERSAFFALPGDVNTLALQIVRAMDRPDEARAKAAAALALSARYTWSERSRRILEWVASLQRRVHRV